MTVRNESGHSQSTLAAKGFVSADGVWFFTNRPALSEITGSLGKRLLDTDGADMYLVVGEGFFGAYESLDKAKRLLFPDSDSAVFKKFMASRRLKKDAAKVKRYARQAREEKIEVRIAKHFIFRSIILADANEPTGWVHVEEALPHIKGENRVSYTIFRDEHPECVKHYQSVFEALWKEARPFKERAQRRAPRTRKNAHGSARMRRQRA